MTNIGSATHAVLDFVPPKGDTGEQGPGARRARPARAARPSPRRWTRRALLDQRRRLCKPRARQRPRPLPAGRGDRRGGLWAPRRYRPSGRPVPRAKGEKGDPGDTALPGSETAAGPGARPARPAPRAQGDTGERGAQGYTFTPALDAAGNLS
ncbi:MAG: hypothetical protein ACLUEK_06020 [Oscillospiraceae bacterium]